MEHAIGEIVTLPDGRKAKVVESKGGCNHCALFLFPFICGSQECEGYHRIDHKNIIYKKIKEE